MVHVLGGMRKTDLRLYAVVTSFDPLRVFLHPVGQVKVAQKAYTADYTDMFAHISNKVGSAEVRVCARAPAGLGFPCDLSTR